MDNAIPKPTAEEQLTEARRELKLRHRVYGRRVSQGFMSQLDADRFIRLQEAIVETLETVAQGTRLL